MTKIRTDKHSFHKPPTELEKVGLSFSSWLISTRACAWADIVPLRQVSQWYVYPRTHIPSDMCIPPIWLPVKCVSPTPHPSKQVSVFISVVFVNSTNHRQFRDYKWFNITSNTIDKRATIRDKIIAKLSLASLLLRGPQCWCKHSFSLLSLSNVIIIHMSLIALNKYDWQNFIQQGITRKVKK